MDGEMALQTTLVGTLSVAESLVGNLSPTSSITGTITLPAMIGGEPYEGEYTVDPDWGAQSLATRNKVMSDDVTVNAIYYSEVSNHSGGKTVYIGGEFNG